MGLETFGRASIVTKDFDGRQLELITLFGIGGEVALDSQGADWEAQKLAYGRQIAIQVADQAVLQMATMYGFNGRTPPEAGVSARNSLKGYWEMGEVGDRVMDIRQQIGGVIANGAVFCRSHRTARGAGSPRKALSRRPLPRLVRRLSAGLSAAAGDERPAAGPPHRPGSAGRGGSTSGLKPRRGRAAFSGRGRG